jgi:hypothetical protein
MRVPILPVCLHQRAQVMGAGGQANNDPHEVRIERVGKTGSRRRRSASARRRLSRPIYLGRIGDATEGVPPVYFPVALIRLAFDGSVPRVMLTVMPGFSSAAVARCPLTVISVNCVMVSVLVALGSVTVIEFAVTLAIVGA